MNSLCCVLLIVPTSFSVRRFFSFRFAPANLNFDAPSHFVSRSQLLFNILRVGEVGVLNLS